MRGKPITEAPTIDDESQKLNPQILRQFIFHIIETRFDRDFDLAAKEFANHTHRKYKTRKKLTINRTMLYDIVCDRRLIKYYQLESISNYLGIPVFIILMFTRLASSSRDSNKEDIENIRNMLAIIERYMSKNEFKMSDISELIKEITDDNLFNYFNI